MKQELKVHVARLLRRAQEHRAAHWMVAGPHFIGLHAHFEELYHRLDGWADQLAERLCRLGGTPPLGLEEIAAQAPAAALPVAGDGRAVVEGLRQAWQELGEATAALARQADAAGDRVTASLLENQLEAIEKELWVLGRLAA